MRHDIDLPEVLPAIGVRFQACVSAANTSVGAKEVDSAVMLENGLHYPDDITFDTDVRNHGHAFNLLGDLVRSRVPVDHDHCTSALPGESSAQRSSDATAPTGYDHHLIANIHRGRRL
jgi:hypothetical protein